MRLGWRLRLWGSVRCPASCPHHHCLPACPPPPPPTHTLTPAGLLEASSPTCTTPHPTHPVTQAFQRILTEIYHIVSKKALASEEGVQVGGGLRGGRAKRRGARGSASLAPTHPPAPFPPLCASLPGPQQRHRHQGDRGGARGQEEDELLLHLSSSTARARLPALSLPAPPHAASPPLPAPSSLLTPLWTTQQQPQLTPPQPPHSTCAPRPAPSLLPCAPPSPHPPPSSPTPVWPWCVCTLRQVLGTTTHTSPHGSRGAGALSPRCPLRRPPLLLAPRPPRAGSGQV